MMHGPPVDIVQTQRTEIELLRRALGFQGSQYIVEKDLRDLRKENRDLKKEKETLLRKLEASTALLLEEEREKLAQSAAKCSDLECKNSALLQSLSALEDIILSLKTDFSQKSETWQQSLTRERAKVGQLEALLDARIQEVSSAHALLSEEGAGKALLETRCAALHAELDSVKANLQTEVMKAMQAEALCQSFETRCVAFQSELDSVKANLRTETTKAAKAEALVESVQREIDAAKVSQADQSTRIESLQLELQEAKKLLSDQLSASDIQRQENDILVKQVEITASALRESSAENAELRNSTKALEEKLALVLADLSSAPASPNDLPSFFAALLQTFQAVVEHTGGSSTTFAGITTLQDWVAARFKEDSEKREALTGLIEWTGLSSKLGNNPRMDLVDIVNNVHDVWNALKSDNHIAVDKISQLDEDLRSVRALCENLKASSSSSEKAFIQAQAKMQVLEEQETSHRNLLAHLIPSIAEMAEISVAEPWTAESTSDAFTRLRNQREDFKLLRVQHLELVDRLGQVEKEAAQQREAFQSELSALKKDESSKLSMSPLRAQPESFDIDGQRERERALEAEIQVLKSSNQDLVQQITDLSAQKASLQSKLGKEQQELTALQTEHRDLLSSMKRLPPSTTPEPETAKRPRRSAKPSTPSPVPAPSSAPEEPTPNEKGSRRRSQTSSQSQPEPEVGKRKLSNSSRDSPSKRVRSQTDDTDARPKRGILKNSSLPPSPVIMISGLKESERVEAEAQASQLKAEVRTTAVFDRTITHVITPPKCRTLKTLAAVLTGKWVMRPEWLSASAKEGKFLPESTFGQRFKCSPFLKKTFSIAPEFTEADKIQNFRTLAIQLGCGIETDDPALADWTLTVDRLATDSKHLTWTKFLSMIPGFEPEK